MQGDLVIVEDTKNIMEANVTDHSDCITEFIEIVPLERDQEFIYPVIEVKLDELQDVKMESGDKTENEDYYVTMVSTLMCSHIDLWKTLCLIILLILHLSNI